MTQDQVLCLFSAWSRRDFTSDANHPNASETILNMGQDHATIRRFAPNLDPDGISGRHSGRSNMQVIARAAEFEDVWTTVQSKVLCDRIGHLANRVPTYMAEIIEEHRRIVEALEKRDLTAAGMRLHLKSVDHAIARLRPLHADYFVEE